MSDQLLIQDGRVTVTTEEGVTIEEPERDLSDMLRAEFMPPLGDGAIPDGVKFIDWRDPLLVVVHQTPSHVRSLRWIASDSKAPFGPEAQYRTVRLSLPYTITFALFCRYRRSLALIGANELYFSNQPVRSKTDRVLCYPALLNISKISIGRRNKAWVCTQYLKCDRSAPWTRQLHALLEHVWNGAFNLSSEHHEGTSWYTECKNVPNLHPVEAWQEASREHDAWALSVDWLPVPCSVGELIEAVFAEAGHQFTSAMLDAAFDLLPRQSTSLVTRFARHVQKKTNVRRNRNRE